MSSSRTIRRALAALGALIVVAAFSVPPALAAFGPGAETALAGPSLTSTTSVAVTTGMSTAPAVSGLRSDDAVETGIVDPGAAIAAAIIERLGLPTGPALLGSPAVTAAPPPAVEAPAAVVAPAAPAEATAPRPARPAADAADRPARDRRPARNGGNADRIEVEVYGAAIPEPPEVASSTTTETVLVAPDPSDPWRAVRECESSGNYRTNTGNGFYGAYQFTIRTWNWVAGIIGRADLIGVRPDQASPADQDRMANALAFEVRGGGLGHWPVCGRLYGS